MNEQIHIGTSGWSYSDWKPDFYPPKLPSGQFLNYYAQTFNVTEVNSSFYRLPGQTLVEGWAAKVPPHFKFCPKMSRYLTHQKAARPRRAA